MTTLQGSERFFFLAKAVATVKLLVSLFRVARPAGFPLGLPGGGKSGERWHGTVRTQTASAVGEVAGSRGDWLDAMCKDT